MRNANWSPGRKYRPGLFVRLWTICGVERILSEKRNNPKGLCVGLNQLRSVLSELVGLLGDRCSVFAGDEYLFILVEDRKRLGDFVYKSVRLFSFFSVFDLDRIIGYFIATKCK